MFRGAEPVFLDILSFDPGDERDSLWRPYAQFVRTFIYPLLASRYFGLRLDEILLANRDGLEPERMAALTKGLRRWTPPFLGAVTIPTLLSRGEFADYRPRRAKDASEARFLLNSVLRRARRLLNRATVREAKNTFTSYMESGHTYTPEQMAAKDRTVTEILENTAPRMVLDIGSNTGHFSRIAARAGARVVAIERDPDATGASYRAAASERLDILPLVVDFSRPPGGCGWDNREAPAFLDRARGKFDCILMLAIVHHLLVTERVPLDRIFELASQLTKRHAIVEYVAPTDSQFRAIARGREALHGDLTRENFESAAQKRFAIRSAWRITATRSIYWLER
jgi:SAM-dependent methyltransferase